jgi:hypothetical protein
MRTLERSGKPRPFCFQARSVVEKTMSKTNAALILRRAERQVANTSGGGHLGGTNFGQALDAKTSSASGKSDKARRPPRGK